MRTVPLKRAIKWVSLKPAINKLLRPAQLLLAFAKQKMTLKDVITMKARKAPEKSILAQVMTCICVEAEGIRCRTHSRGDGASREQRFVVSA